MRTKRQPAGSAVSAFRRLPIVLAVAGALSQGAMAVVPPPTTITVNNGNAFGPGSLYQAILDANTACDLGDSVPTITFSGPFTINQSVGLPQFSCINPNGYSPTIDAANVSGASANSSSTEWNATLAVVVDFSSNFATYGCGIERVDFGGYGGMLTIKGLDVRNFSYGGFSAFGNQTGICGKVTVVGSAVRNVPTGLFAESGSVIGGDTVADRNLINGFHYDGIGFDGNTFIKNNLIGIDFDGNGIAVASTGDYGIDWCGCNDATGTIAKNVIVANYTGIYAGSYESSGLTISGNKIGTNPAGTEALGNSYDEGIYLYQSMGATIDDNVLAGWTYGLSLNWTDSVTVTNNRIGTNDAGSAAIANIYGISDYYGYGNRIENNTISGNSDSGIWLQNTSNVLVTKNRIGLDSGGTTQIGNNWGIYIGLSPVNNVIDDNAIAGNFAGIYSTDASNTTFSNNKIGTTFGGANVPNLFGLVAECGSNLSFISNIISGNMYGGLILGGIQNSVLNGNTIGGSYPNGGGGVSFDTLNCSGGEVQAKVQAKALFIGDVDSSDNQLILNTITNNTGPGVSIHGGAGNSLFQNTISGNTGDGVFIDSIYGSDPYGGTIVTSSAVGNSILENLIFGNGAKNVNLAFPGGPLPNDPGDGDSGKPNNWQNYPVLDSAVYDPTANSTTIAFTLDTQAGNYRIDFFANPMPGAPAGQTYIGNTFIVSDGDGAASGSYAASGHHNNISAIATRMMPLDTLPPSYVATDSSELSLQVPGSTLPTPGVSVNPTVINFGDVVVGRSSGNSSVTVLSTGTAPYVVNSLREGACTGPAICSTGSFVCSTTCADGSTWSPGNYCTITASFNPTALGPQGKILALCDNAAGSPRTITFSGNGVEQPVVDIAYSPSSWSFGEVLAGQQSAPKSFTLTNSGTNTVYLGPATATDDFIVTGGSCAAELSGGASCTTDVVFAPAARGGANGTVQIVGSNTPPATAAALRAKVASPTSAVASARLAGSGVQHGDLSLPSNISFGTMVLHSGLRQQNLSLTNTGNGALAISSITVSGPFTMTNDCGSSVAAGASCTVMVSFSPSAVGNATGTLTIVSDAPGGSRAIALSANVTIDARPSVHVSSAIIGFGNRVIGSESSPARLTITNEGSQQAVLGAITFTQPEGGDNGKKEFSVANTTCGALLDPQASCVADIVFKPLGFGPRDGQLQVPSNSADTPQRVTLGGTGCRPFVAGGNRAGGRDPCAP